MLKRVLLISLAVAVALTMNVAPAQAGNWSFLLPPGMWWWYGSANGCAKIGSVPNPKNRPAVLQCDVEFTESYCVNPNGKLVLPGEASRKISVTEPIDTKDLDKKEKGVANVCVSIDPGCELRNWTWVATEFEATCTTNACLDAECTQVEEASDTQRCLCSLPVPVSEAVPCKGPNDTECTQYECLEIDIFGNPTGEYCELAR
jgi:hypothetical protein